MDSLSRRRKLSNVNSFSGKNAYDGVFSGRRPKYDGAPAVRVEEYGEIFSTGQADSSIPVLDISSLEESCDSEIWSTKPDYGMIFGGFRDQDIAISYEELVARDNARACSPSSASQRSQDSGDLSNQPLDSLKHFNLAYNKISQRSKDGLDGTTQVTQLPAVSGFTCFINESTSQPKKETKNRNSFVTNNIHPSLNSSKVEFPEKQASQSNVDSRSRHQDESLSGERIVKTFEADLKTHPSKVSSLHAASQPNKKTESQKSSSLHATSQPNKETESQKLSSSSPAASQPNKETKSQKSSSSPAASQPNKETESQKSSSPHPNKETESLSKPSLAAASQPNKETENQKSYITDNIHLSKGDFHEKQTSGSRFVQDESLLGDGVFKNLEVDLKSHPSKVSPPPEASQPKKETENQKPVVTDNIRPSVSTASKEDFHEKQTSQSAVEFKSRYQDESLSGDNMFKTLETDLKSHPSKVTSSTAASQLNKETESQKSFGTYNIQPSVNSSKGDFHEKQTSKSAVESKVTETFEVKSHPPKVASPPAVPATKFDNQKRTATYGESSSTCFHEEIDVNSAAAISTAALRKAIEKAQKSIRIAKESVGRETRFSSRSFKDDLKVKAKDKMKERDYKHESTTNLSDFMVGEKLFGAKKVTNELHGKIPELGKNSEILIRSPVELKDNKVVCNPKEVGKTEFVSTENNTCEGPQKDVEKPDGFLVYESCEKKLGDLESNNLTVHQKVEDEKEIPGKSDEDGFEKKDFEESFGLFETKKQENLEQGHDEKVEDEREVKEKEEEQEKLSDVCEVEMIKNAETYDCSIETNDLSQNEDYEIKEKENDKVEDTWEKLDNIQVPETYEKSSVDFDDAEESKSVIGESQIVNDTEEACKVDQNDSNEEPSQQIDDVSRSSSSGHEFQVEETETTEKGKTENISSNETEDKDECDAKSDDLANCGLADMDFVQDDGSVETNNVSQNEDCEIKEEENHNAEETWKNLDTIQVSNDYNEAETSEFVIGASQIVDDIEEASKVDQTDKESSQEIDYVSSSISTSSDHDFQVDDMEALEKEMIENTSSDETEDNEDECDAQSDDLANCDLADVDFAQNNVESESTSDTVLGMQIEVKEHKQREEAVGKEDNNLQQPHEEAPETRTKTESGTQQEPGPSKTEQERIKLAVDRVIREARERAFAEVRQRVIAETQEKVTKASFDKTSERAKLKAERAAVERATAEARQRALEKAVSQKQTTESKVQVKEINQTTNAESALRSKAKLEKDNRIMERAAKALAEKEKRDLLALREQLERNRLAENLDADIKRWSSGKEGNLRALLSTLQYILGADSGWQPVSLTDIITTNAVKKAYRKATLCVHPDKLQQRGATIQQKYICEKVFDLLKAAWNRFNSEER